MAIGWAAVRAQFPVTERGVYLNTGWSGPSSRAVVRAMAERLEREAYDGPTTLAVRHEKALLVRRTRAALAEFIGAAEDELALVYTTTEGVNTVLRGLGLGPGDEVLTCNLEHNAVMVPSYVGRRREGYALNIVRLAPEMTAVEVLEAFETAMTPRTGLVLVSHVSFNRGTRLPMRELCAKAHARGALVAVDAAQSVGHIGFDVREMGCDFMAFPGHKWLLGPDGAAALYVRRDHIERLEPLAVVHGANVHYDYEGNFEEARDTIHKFELTTHSGPVLAGLLASLEMLQAIGLLAVEARCLALADRFIAGLEEIGGVRTTTPLDTPMRSGIVTFNIGDLNPSEACAALDAAAGITMRVCNDKRLRACFHIFNDESDVDRTLAAVETLAGQRLPSGAMTEAQYKEMVLEAED